MCEECRQYPCHPRCPNAPEPPIFAKCKICGEPIYAGDEYFELDGHNYCEACVNGGYRTAEVDYE